MPDYCYGTKEYQKHCINEVKIYLEPLAEFHAKYDKILAIDPDMAGDFMRKAWERAKGDTMFQGEIYHDKKNGLGKRSLPIKDAIA